MRNRISYPAIFLGLALLAACGEGESRTPEPAAAPDMASTAAATEAEDANAQELANYDLNTDDLKKLEKAQFNFTELMRTRPDLKEKLEGDDSEDDGSNVTFDDLEAKINEVPEAREAIESAGMDVRDYAVVLLAMVHARMADALIGQGVNQDSVLRDMHVNRNNVEFVRQHEAEVARIMKIGEED